MKLSAMAAFLFGPKAFTKDMGTRSQLTAVLASTLPEALLSFVSAGPVLKLAPANKFCLRCCSLSSSQKRGLACSVLLKPWNRLMSVVVLLLHLLASC